MHKDLYEKILKELLDLNEFSSMGGGAVGGVSTPLGTGPTAGKGGGDLSHTKKGTMVRESKTKNRARNGKNGKSTLK